MLTRAWFRSFCWGAWAMGGGFGCQLDPQLFSRSLAKHECQFARRCTPAQFEARCLPCERHEQCPRGACDMMSGRCRDELGRPLLEGALFEPCPEQGAPVCGGWVCRPYFVDAAQCREQRQDDHAAALSRFEAFDQDPSQGCAYSQDLANACLDAYAKRSCQDPEPKSCELALRDCG